MPKRLTTIGTVTVRVRADRLGNADWSLTCRAATFPDAIAAILAANEQLLSTFGQPTPPDSPRRQPSGLKAVA